MGSGARCGVEDAGDTVAKLPGVAVTGGMLPGKDGIEGEEGDDDMPVPLR